jgi:flagellar motor protein MotB
MTTMRWIAISTMVAFPLLPSCYSDLKRRNEDLANQNHQLESELNQTKAERDEGRTREDILQKQVSTAREESRATREASTLRNTPSETANGDAHDAVAKSEAPRKVTEKKSASEVSALAKKLNASLAATKAHVEAKDGRVCVSLPLGASFAPGSADLDSKGKKLVDDTGKILLKELSRDQKMFVVGHTDSDPPKKSKAKYPDNHARSYARAQAVVSELKSVGIETKRMIPSGAGESSPIAAGTGSKEKEKNRRVEIWID